MRTVNACAVAAVGAVSLLACAAGTLVSVRQQGTAVYLYRAVRIGNHTLIVAPEGRNNGQCISCVTERYFVRIVQ